MIYEMFKAASVDGLGLGEWVGCIIAALYMIHLALIILSYLGRYLYGYIQDFQAEGRLVYQSIVRRLIEPPKEEVEVPRWFTGTAVCNTNDGWWRLIEFHDGYYQDYDLASSEPKDTAYDITVPKITWEFNYALREGNSGGLRMDVQGKLQKANVSSAVCAGIEPYEMVMAFGPLALATGFIFLDSQPVAALTIAALYGTLRSARGVVRMGKRVTTLETTGESK